jgi:hypothetical protein
MIAAASVNEKVHFCVFCIFAISFVCLFFRGQNSL